MFTAPPDLDVDLIRAALDDGWSVPTTSLEYQAVGFGSHHWLATGVAGDRLFVTIDDQSQRRRSGADSYDAAFGRLERAFTTALSLRHDAGLDFVVAPVPAASGAVLVRLTDKYSLVVHPYLAGAQAHADGRFATWADRLEVIELLARLHAVQATPPDSDPFIIRQADELALAVERTGQRWDGGPYAERARVLLARDGSAVVALLGAYDRLAQHAAARPDRMVITHGEPGGANVLQTAAAGFVLVDWESTLLAPPERDLWDLAADDPSVVPVYTAATGTQLDPEVLRLYRLQFDLAEISEYIAWFCGEHGETADTAEAWQNLQYYLRPAERWPDLVAG